MVDTDDTQQMTMPGVWQELPTGELKILLINVR